MTSALHNSAATVSSSLDPFAPPTAPTAVLAPTSAQQPYAAMGAGKGAISSSDPFSIRASSALSQGSALARGGGVQVPPEDNSDGWGDFSDRWDDGGDVVQGPP
eukprot:scaffold144502_cov16-Tisochrysis_lutea.AAC.1